MFIKLYKFNNNNINNYFLYFTIQSYNNLFYITNKKNFNNISNLFYDFYVSCC